MGRMLLIGFLALVVVVGLLFVFGPRIPVDTNVAFEPSAIGDDADAYLAQSESRIEGIRDGLAKEIVWADPATRARTPVSIVYVHGFSASKGEIRPVPDIVAAELGANLFYTRLTGHGQDGAAMAGASVNDWINDYAEAIAIGRAIGDRVVVIATSTGGTLASWAATRPELSQDVAGLVLVSPNYGAQAAGAWVLTMPWGGLIADLASGRERGFEPVNEAHERYWTSRYPTRATLPMAALTGLARNARAEDATIPALFIYSGQDLVVRPELTREVAERWGAPHFSLVVDSSDDPSNHVIAGDAISPSTTNLVAGRIIEWVRSLSD